MERNKIVFQDYLVVFVSWTRLPLFSNLLLDILVIFYLIRVWLPVRVNLKVPLKFLTAQAYAVKSLKYERARIDGNDRHTRLANQNMKFIRSNDTCSRC